MFDKITSRIQKLCYGLNADFVDPVSPTLPPPALTPTSPGQKPSGNPGRNSRSVLCWIRGSLWVSSRSGCSVIP